MVNVSQEDTEALGHVGGPCFSRDLHVVDHCLSGKRGEEMSLFSVISGGKKRNGG